MQNAAHRSPKSRSKKATKRLGKEQWLKQALVLLEKCGPAAVTLDSLTSNMGVTTGSFYHHFGSHGRFLDQLTDKYIQDYTDVVKERIDSLELPPRELLIEAMRQIITSGLGGMDLHFRALAFAYPQVAEKIRAMDDLRTGIIRSLFEGIGYTGDELRMRVHTFVVLHSLESAITSTLTADERLKLIDERVKLLID